MIITVPGTWDRANRKKDKSVSLAFTTNLEISNEDFATMDLHVGESGWVSFSPNEISLEDIPKGDAQDQSKSKATRLRNVLYVRWETLTDKVTPFDQYYDTQMERLIERLKQDLPERN